MLPIPILNFFPRIFQSDNKAVTLAAYIDALLLLIKSEISQLPRLYRADEVNSLYLNELGYFLSANILNVDTDQQKRKKIYNAIATTKLRGTWKYDVKKRIDIITGYDSQIITLTDSSDWILCGDGISEFGYYATLGCDGIDDNLGLNLIGVGDEIEIPGNIYIDLHPGINTPILTQDILKQIVDEIKNDVIPAYYRIYLGYLDVNGNFIKYEIYEMFTIPISSNSTTFCVENNNIWIGQDLGTGLLKIDPNTNVITNIPDFLGFKCYGVAFDGTYIWASDFNNDFIHKINITTNEIVSSLATGGSQWSVYFDGTYIWVDNSKVMAEALSRIVPASETVVSESASISYDFASQMAFDGTYLWVANWNIGVLKINAATFTLADKILIATPVTGIVFDGTNIWVAHGDKYLSKINITTTPISIIETFDLSTLYSISPQKLTFDGINIWGTIGSTSIFKFSIKDYTLNKMYGIFSANDILYHNNILWVTGRSGSNTVVKIKFIKDLEE